MTFQVFTNSLQGAYFVVLAVSGALTIVAITLRFVATRLAHRKPAWEDWFALAAVTVFLSRVGSVLYGLTVINGRGLILAFDRQAYETSFKIIFVADLITICDQSLAKFSICALYLRVFGVNDTYRRWTWVLALLQLAVNMALFITQFLSCRPLNKYWQWWVDGTCQNTSTLLAAIEPFNSVIDFALVVLAMFIIRALHVPQNTKWKLRFLFGLGGLAGIFGFIKIGVAYSPNNLAYTAVQLGIWGAVQSLACIICCCAAVYKPLLPETGLFRRLVSKVSIVSMRNTKKSATSGTDAASRQRETSTDSVGGQDSQDWLRVDGSRSNGSAWAANGPAVVENPHAGGDPAHNAYPLSSIHVHKSVEVV